MSKNPFKKAKEKLAKVAQKATQAAGIEGVLDELPNTETLRNVEKLSLKLEAIEDIENAVKDFIMRNNQDFEPVRFLLADSGGNLRFVAEMCPESGFKVRKAGSSEIEIMRITLPTESEDCLGKIQHPTGATLYKVFDAGPKQYTVSKTVSTDENFMKIRKHRTTKLRFAKLAGLSFHDAGYRLVRHDAVVAKIKPNISFNAGDEHFRVKFYSENTQNRAVGVGVGLMFTLDIVHPMLRNLLRETMTIQEGEK